jgi:hypothetical protein
MFTRIQTSFADGRVPCDKISAELTLSVLLRPTSTCRSRRYGPPVEATATGLHRLLRPANRGSKNTPIREGERTGVGVNVTAGAGGTRRRHAIQNAVILIRFRLARDVNGVVCACHCADKQFKPKVKAKSLDGPR